MFFYTPIVKKQPFIPKILYYTDFSEYAIGVGPYDWTFAWNTTDFNYWEVISEPGATGNQVLITHMDFDILGLLYWNKVGSVTDICISSSVKEDYVHSTANWLIARASGTTGYENCYYLMLDSVIEGQAPFVSQTNPGVGLWKRVNGVSTMLAHSYFNWYVNQWVSLKLQVNGNIISGKYWISSNSEPIEWQFIVTDSDITTAGYVGLGAIASSIYEWDTFTVSSLEPVH
jgi:hypothetical protein